MSISLSAAVLFGFLVWLLWRYAGLRTWHVVVCVLFGFYLVSSAIGPRVGQALVDIAHFVARLHL